MGSAIDGIIIEITDVFNFLQSFFQLGLYLFGLLLGSGKWSISLTLYCCHILQLFNNPLIFSPSYHSMLVLDQCLLGLWNFCF